MSGSGGSGGPSGSNDGYTDCESLAFETNLSSPKANVVATLSVGSVLDVEVRQQGTQSIVVAIFGGNVAGGLATPQLQRLRQCIANGVRFRADVLFIREGQVKVRVTAGQ